jgi:hypothetical protein
LFRLPMRVEVDIAVQPPPQMWKTREIELLQLRALPRFNDVVPRIWDN